MINKEKIKELSKEEINILVDFIGPDISLPFVRFYSEKVPEQSQYHIGKSNGRFWRGFRVDTLPAPMIRRFYNGVIKENPKIVLEAIEVMVYQRMGITQEELEDAEKVKDKISELKDHEVIPILLNLFDTQMEITFEQYKTDLEAVENREARCRENLKKEYEDKIESLIDNYRKRISSINEEKQQIEKEKNRLEKELSELKKKSFSFISKLRQNSLSNQKVDRLISALETTEVSGIKESFLLLREENRKKFDQGEDISEDLIIEYLLYRMMEESK